jgi:expansin (peptidoglycan-binding protein)
MRSFITFAITLLTFSALVLSAPVSLDESNEVGLERRATSGRITYYTGSMLQNPACGGPDPSNNSMIAAVKKGGKYGCGDTLRIKSGSKSVTVTVVDYCAGCSSTAVDLTSGAFKRLAKLSKGVVNGKVTKM